VIDDEFEWNDEKADANAKKHGSPEEIERYKTYHDPIRLWKRRMALPMCARSRRKWIRIKSSWSTFPAAEIKTWTHSLNILIDFIINK